MQFCMGKLSPYCRSKKGVKTMPFYSDIIYLYLLWFNGFKKIKIRNNIISQKILTVI